ncbi:MAG: ATP-grasp domain-containing protein [Verrucomicrobia bacterium]|nr:ATP-grasp domain-containing protein [Verrucomicrobiota bacterium]MCG2680239.1 ATP-grasp domain-containing protein [Kiritimatiellia bacterium]MBU4247668.1 ATP-grasp domain-containing protein [Verrucomicrobiota bacterium]MBU4289796.1 ATP-grasp domain-containing protein [Verrucomicrobiota bacterium]MBU4428061.1 ATP-grasp domain-containing protein [Verrucomicrobiota bacterium]
MSSPARPKSNRLRIVVLYDAAEPKPGRRGEEASERATARAAAQADDALTAAGFRTTLLPVRNCLTDLVDHLRRARPDVVVNLCEGFAGHPAFEAQVAGLLELMNIPFTGNPSAALFLCQDKYRTKAVLKTWGLPVPGGWLAATANAIPGRLHFPLIVKPNTADASIGIGPDSVVRNRAALIRQTARLVKRYGQPALIEDYVDGREFNVAVVEDAAELRPLPISEIVFRDLPKSLPHIVGYDAKWKTACAWYQKTEPLCPALIPARQSRRLEQLARAACAALRVRGYARVDFRVDRRGRPFILEVNPNPDSSREAGLARALTAAGIAYETFWEQQVRRAHGRANHAMRGKHYSLSLF